MSNLSCTVEEQLAHVCAMMGDGGVVGIHRIKELEKSTGSTLDVDREAGLIKVRMETQSERPQ